VRISVIGGGISGLAAAWELSADPSVQITVHEAAARLGGKIHTSPFAGRMVDEGADAFLRRVPEAVALCGEIGLEELISPSQGSAMVWVDGELKRLPGGLVLGVPVHFDDLEASGILTHWGIARARHEPELEGEPLVGDSSIGAVITRRYGQEVTDRLVGPLLGGIAAGSVDTMSIDAMAPQLAAAAHRSRSLAQALADTPPSFQPGGVPDPVFAAPAHGMGSLIARLETQLRERGVLFVTGQPVTSLPAGDGTVLTTPAPVTASLVAPRSPGAAELLSSIRLASVVFTALAFRRDDVPGALDASGFLVPRTAGLTITAASWSSTKWERLEGDPVILRVSIGHDRDPDSIELSDDEVLGRITADLGTVMGITASPVDHRITRYRDGFPQYDVGHLERTDRLEALLAHDAPDLAVCGMAHRGVGIPACIREARRAAASLRTRLTTTD